MAVGELVQRRLANQGLLRPLYRTPAEVVAWLGAVQAQEYQPAKWALGLRMRGAVDNDVERAVDEGTILRTHVLRPTWHFVAAADLIWMQRLTGPRVQRAMEVYRRQMSLDAPTLRRATTIFERALRDRHFRTRTDLAAHLQRAGIPLTGIRLAHAALYAEFEAVICSGPRLGKHSTYALVAERVGESRDLSGDEALAELARRFFRSHGPATIRDFVWWSGLPTADARRGLEIIRARSHARDGHTYWTAGSKSVRGDASELVHLLPIYDEYLVAYRDRALVPHGPAKAASRSRPFVTFQHALTIGGAVAGSWRPTRAARGVSVQILPLRKLTAKERAGIEAAAARYEQFLQSPVIVQFG
jgi:hypothetical protein